MRGELEARDQAREHWGASECIRAAQANGKFSCDLLYALNGAHVEVKRYARISAIKHLEQADNDRQEGEFPVVLMRGNHDTRWVVMFYIKDTDRFTEATRRV